MKIFPTIAVIFLLSLSQALMAQWQWNNPQPQGNDLWNVGFAPGTSVCWAVGGAGSIIKSADAGATWVVQESQTGEFLRGLAAPTANDAYAVGDNGTILVTHDGGASWSPSVSGTTDGFNEAAAIGADEVWAVGDAGMILHTANGGASWQAQTSGVATNINAVSFIDPMRGWCVGSGKSVLRTTNGGAAWQASVITGMGSYDLIDVFFLNDQLGWAVGTSGATVRTTNGGANWTRINTGSTIDLNKVVFLDAQNGYAVGETGFMMKSVNGGLAWTPVATGAVVGLEGLDVSGSNLVAVGVFGEIRRSAAGGPVTSGLTGSQSTFNAVACEGGLTAWAAGEGGRIVRTTDGGATWLVPPSPTTNALYGLASIDDQTAWACGEAGVMLHTTNGGASWQVQATGQNVAFNAVDFTDAMNGTAVGLSGKIIRTTNGGQSWSVQASGTLQSLYGVDMQDAQTGTVVGGNGVILTTTNGGATWLPQTSGTADALFSVVRWGDQGWIAGDAGTILYTDDDGANWDLMTTGVTAALFHLVVTSPGSMAAVGENGVIIRSDDAGQTWTPELSHAMYNIYSIACKGGAVRTAGDFGMVLANTSYPVPVELATFAGGWNGRAVELRWTTASEINNEGFGVERKSPGGWSVLGFVPAGRGAAGNAYTFTDATVAAGDGVATYRLRQRDLDGTETCGPELRVRIAPPQPGSIVLTVHPNPVSADGALEILVRDAEHAGAARLRIVNCLGLEVADLTSQVAGTDPSAAEISLRVSARCFQESGLYFAVYESAGRRVVRSIVATR